MIHRLQIMRTLHLVDTNGNKRAIDSNQLNERINKEYQIDVDWYLSHGYSKVEDMFREIENN